MWFEEQHWKKKGPDDGDPHSLTSRLRRAANCLLDPGVYYLPCSSYLCNLYLLTSIPYPTPPAGESTSSANFCISLDRGYGHIEAQEGLAAMGIYSNAMMQSNRIGLPRQFVEQLSKDLSSCSQEVLTDEVPRKCMHGPTAEGCRKFCFTALHKAPKQTADCTNSAAS